MADGGVIKVVSSRCKKICGVFMLFVSSFQVFTILHCFQLLSAQTPRFFNSSVMQWYTFEFLWHPCSFSYIVWMHLLAQLVPLPSKYLRGWQTFCVKMVADLNAQDDRDW
jgi:hypothetical protein